MATTLLVCCLCHKRVSPASHVLVRPLPAHQACGDGWYAQKLQELSYAGVDVGHHGRILRDKINSPTGAEMTATQTPGQALTAELRRYFHVGPRTRQTRNGESMVERMLDAMTLAAQYDGYYCQPTNEIFAEGFAVTLAYRKHVDGYRLNGETILRIRSLSPWDFAALAGEMVDAEIDNNGKAERWLPERFAPVAA